MGRDGAFMVLIMFTMLMMATGSGEVMGISSIIVYDFYQSYICPFRLDNIVRFKSWCILWVAVGIVPFGLVMLQTGIDLNWVFLTGCVMTIPCFPGVVLSIVWVKTTAKGMVIGEFLLNTSEGYTVMAGSCTSFFVTLIVTVIVSLVTHNITDDDEARLEWQKVRDIDNPLNPWVGFYREEFPNLRHNQKPSYEELETVFRKAKVAAIVGSVCCLLLFIILIPGVMASMHVLTRSEFGAWVTTMHVWCFVMAVVVIVVTPAEETMAEKGKDIEPSWQEAPIIAEKVDVQERFAANVIELLDMGATIPFIARYRKEKTGDMPVEKLREISSSVEELRCATSNVQLESKKSKPKTAAVKKKTADKDADKTQNGGQGKMKKEPPDNSFKFEQYFDFLAPIRTVKPHQILAINRGEEQKILTAKIIMPDSVKHDVPKTKLQTALDSVVEECVSFVGVDLNTATKANKILEWRAKNGQFINRTQLLAIKGFGEKLFEQCAGFVRVVHDLTQEDIRSEAEKPEPEAAPKAGQKRKAGAKAGSRAKKAKLASSDNVNLLDMTAIHPESYHVATRIAHAGQLSESFEVKTGVRQGCLLSPFLFLLVINWIMKTTTAGRKNGIQWTRWMQLDDLDFADDLALLSHSHSQMQDKTTCLEATSAGTGLKINRKKTELMKINTTANTTVTVGGEPIREVESFVYLGSVVDGQGGTDRDITARMGKARAAMVMLKNVWASKVVSIRTKLRIFNSNVKSVLL
nr:hypothetical protein BaRGS_003340 [Batillaria attramentaria]